MPVVLEFGRKQRGSQADAYMAMLGRDSSSLWDPLPMQIDMIESETEEAEPQFTVTNPQLELDSLVSNHTSYIKLARLMFIAEHCPGLEIEALKMAITAVQETHNTILYSQIHQRLTAAVKKNSSLPDAVAGLMCPPFDSKWANETHRNAETKLARIDSELKEFKNSSVKESIRRGYLEMGEHYLDWGKLQDALKSFMRMKDYNTMASHSLSMCTQVILVSVHQKSWHQVLTYVRKGEQEIEHHLTKLSKDADRDGSSSKNQPYLEPRQMCSIQCAAGLAELGRKQYKNAALRFLQAQFDHTDFPHLITTSEVARYGAVCALASFDRRELQKHLLNSSTFKLFLEPEPNMREILYTFNNSQYSRCLSLLDSIKDWLMLDVYLSPHVTFLYSRVRRTALCQYFSPYMTADLKLMASAFNSSVNDIENELMELILEGRISARIDSHNKVLTAKDINSRHQTFENALAAGLQYQKIAKHAVLRTAAIKAGVQVQSDSTSGSN